MNMLTKRQEDILRLIIQNYTSDEQPVGSKTLMESGIEASSATIRNEMKTLETKGLVLKTHSSSGRVPSLNGYRYYVDHLLVPNTVSTEEIVTVKHAFAKEFHEINEIIRQSAALLSQMTNYTALALGPEMSDRKLTGFRMIPLNQRQVVTIIVTDKGNVQSSVFTIPSTMKLHDLETIASIVNDRLLNESLLTVYHRLRTEIPMIMNRYFQSTEGILDVFEHLLSQAFEDKVFVSGRMNVLNFEADQSGTNVKQLYDFMKDSETLGQLFASRNGSIQVKIGKEIGVDLFENMSMIQANYEIENHGLGTIALLGPANMPYAQMYSLMNLFKDELAMTLADYYKGLDHVYHL